jgi:hypothetical protein
MIKEVQNIIDNEILKCNQELSSLLSTRIPIIYKSTQTFIVLEEYILKGSNQELVLKPNVETNCIYKGTIPFTKFGMNRLGIDIKFTEFRNLTYTLNRIIKVKFLLKILQREKYRIKESPQTEKPSIHDHYGVLSFINEQKNTASKVFYLAKNNLQDFFKESILLHSLYKKWEKIIDYNFSLHLSAISQIINLNLIYFKAKGFIDISSKFGRNDNLISLIPNNDKPNYEIELNKPKLEDLGIIITKRDIKQIYNRLLKIKYLEYKIKYHEILLLYNKIKLFDSYDLITPNLESLLFFHNPLCDDLRIKEVEKDSDTYNSSYESSDERTYVYQTNKNEVSTLNKVAAYAMFGMAVQAGKRTIQSDSFIGSAANGILTGIFYNAGKSFLK